MLFCDNSYICVCVRERERQRERERERENYFLHSGWMKLRSKGKDSFGMELNPNVKPVDLNGHFKTKDEIDP